MSSAAMIKRPSQQGFTLVEILIAMVLSLIAMAAVFSMFINSVRGNSQSLKQIRLNQEMRALMDVMVRDIRRAGYSSTTTDGTRTTNAFLKATNDVDTIFLTDNAGCETSGTDANYCQCIIYRYDYANDGNTANNANNYGFKFENNQLYLRQNSAACGDGGWAILSDSNTIALTNIDFFPSQECFNVTQNDSCTNAPPAAGETTSTMYFVTISMSGQLANDASFSLNLNEEVAVRNTESVVN